MSPEEDAIVDVTTFQGADWYLITIDTRSYTDVGFHNFTMQVEILD